MIVTYAREQQGLCIMVLGSIGNLQVREESRAYLLVDEQTSQKRELFDRSSVAILKAKIYEKVKVCRLYDQETGFENNRTNDIKCV